METLPQLLIAKEMLIYIKELLSLLQKVVIEDNLKSSYILL